MSGSLPANSPSGGKASVLADLAIEEVFAAPRLGDVLDQLAAPRHRVDIRVDAPHRDTFSGRNALL
jgi:hypothetical protein